MRGPQLEHQLVLVAEVDGLQVLAGVQVPEVQPAAVLGAEQNLGNEAVLEGIGRAPLARHHGVVPEMPPGVIGEVLRAAIHLPLAQHVEGLVVHQEHAARSLALAVAERRDIDAFRSAVHGVRARVSGPLGHVARLDHLDDGGTSGVGLGVEDVDARGPQARHDEIAPLDMRMRRVGAEA